MSSHRLHACGCTRQHVLSASSLDRWNRWSSGRWRMVHPAKEPRIKATLSPGSVFTKPEFKTLPPITPCTTNGKRNKFKNYLFTCLYACRSERVCMCVLGVGTNNWWSDFGKKKTRVLELPFILCAYDSWFLNPLGIFSCFMTYAPSWHVRSPTLLSR